MTGDAEYTESIASTDEAEEKRKRSWYDTWFKEMDAAEAANPTLTLLRCPAAATPH